jgi:hypothetical protein
LLTFSGKSRRLPLRLLTAAEIAVCLKELKTGGRVRQDASGAENAIFVSALSEQMKRLFKCLPWA